MAAAGFTPISLYYTTTSGAGGIPSAGNLVNGELAINITDGKLYYKDNGGTVQVIATKATGTIGGSTTQVQYNNAGVLAGSSNLTFDGTSLTLGGNPTLSAGTANGVLYLNGSKVATSGSALTFDGTTFSNVQASGTAALSFNQLSFSRNGANYLTATLSSLNYGASQHIFGDNTLASEWMRLTSTGLGIGTSSPSQKLTVVGNALVTPTGGWTTGGVATQYFGDVYGSIKYDYNTTNFLISSYGSFSIATNNISPTTRLTVDSSGNLGLGVTPSAWYSNQRAFQIGDVGSFRVASSSVFGMNNNAYFAQATTDWRYSVTGFSTRYDQESGQHRWYTAASGTAGNAITFTQAMTLDASGNLLLGTTNGNGLKLDFSPSSSQQNGITYVISSPNSYTDIYGCGTSGAWQGAIRFFTSNNAAASERARITSGGNFKIGGTADRGTTEGDKQLVLFNGTAPVGTLTNGISLYSSSGEAYVMDAAGNATLFSPHDRDTNEWIFRSKHTPSGKVLKIDVERLLRFVNDHFGLDAVQKFIEP